MLLAPRGGRTGRRSSPAPCAGRRAGAARRGGATILALDRGDARLADVAHEALTVTPAAPLTFDAAQHLVSAAVGERMERPRRLRARLARLLDTVSGPVSP